MDGMLTGLERYVPGIKESVVFKDLGTPLSNQYYINATAGNLYGTDKGVWQVGPFAFAMKTAFAVVAVTTSRGHSRCAPPPRTR